MRLSSLSAWVACVDSREEAVIELARAWAEQMEVSLNTGATFETLPPAPQGELSTGDAALVEAAANVVIEAWEFGAQFADLLASRV